MSRRRGDRKSIIWEIIEGIGELLFGILAFIAGIFFSD